MKKRAAIAVAIAAILFAIAWYFLARPMVEVFVVRRGTAISATYGTVRVVPELTFNIRARASGVLHYNDAFGQVPSLVGREVKKGELLGWVMNDDLDRAYTKAELEWKAAQDRRQLGPADAAALKTQQALVGRLENLVSLKNIPQVDLERARNELTAMTELVRREQIEIDRAVAVAQQEYDNLKDRKELCKFISPIDGTLQTVTGGNGEFINEGSTPFVVISKTVFLEGQIDEEDVGHVAPGMKAAVKLYAYPDLTLTEKVTQLRPGANNQRYTVNLTLDHPPRNVMIDMTGEMNIISGERQNALIVPTRALLSDHVWVVEGGVVRPRMVKVGFRNPERAEIREGLREGEKVVVADQDLLQTGERVRVAVINQ
jgi:macrolide-specific efflux system membrane fusion protein